MKKEEEEEKRKMSQIGVTFASSCYRKKTHVFFHIASSQRFIFSFTFLVSTGIYYTK
jgi:hypothetical protein